MAGFAWRGVIILFVTYYRDGVCFGNIDLNWRLAIALTDLMALHPFVCSIEIFLRLGWRY